jgi:hypothetical protein
MRATLFAAVLYLFSVGTTALPVGSGEAYKALGGKWLRESQNGQRQAEGKAETDQKAQEQSRGTSLTSLSKVPWGNPEPSYMEAARRGTQG